MITNTSSYGVNSTHITPKFGMARRLITDVAIPGVEKLAEQVPPLPQPRMFAGFRLPFLPPKRLPDVSREFYSPEQIAKALEDAEHIVDLPLSTQTRDVTGLIAGQAEVLRPVGKAVGDYRQIRHGLHQKAGEDGGILWPERNFAYDIPGAPRHESLPGIQRPTDTMSSVRENPALSRVVVSDLSPRFNTCPTEKAICTHTPDDIDAFQQGVPAVIERDSKTGNAYFLTAEDAQVALDDAAIKGTEAVEEIKGRTIRRPGLFQEPVVKDQP